VALLRDLDDENWAKPTVAGPWRVRDVVAHLLDGDLRKLSGGRDGHQVTARSVSSFAGIVDLINELNAGGVKYVERLSPRLMTDLLEVTGAWVSTYVAELPAHAPSHIAVAWAGEERSENWLDTGREYTERWHHQMQIRAAVGAPKLLERRWLHPVLDLSVRAFRPAYRETAASIGTTVVFQVNADEEHAWSVVRMASGWDVMRGRAADAAATLTTDADSSWKLLFNALSSDSARARVAITGDHKLTEPMLRSRAVMV
jgi:hypothetical protein